jgi:hypothetical protein
MLLGRGVGTVEVGDHQADLDTQALPAPGELGVERMTAGQLLRPRSSPKGGHEQ